MKLQWRKEDKTTVRLGASYTSAQHTLTIDDHEYQVFQTFGRGGQWRGVNMLAYYDTSGKEDLFDICAKSKVEFTHKVQLAAFSKDLTHVARKWRT